MFTPSKEYKKFLTEAKKTLVACYRDSLEENSPEAAAELLIDQIGAFSAAEIVSALVLIKSHDGRISLRNREWAEKICSHTEAELSSVSSFWYCDEIHPAHFDQIADCIRKTIRPAKAAE